MTREEQRLFVEDLTRTILAGLLTRADKWPEKWDGHELRCLVALAADVHTRISAIKQDPRGERARAFRNDILTHPTMF